MGGVSCPKPSYKKRKPEPVQKIKMQEGVECWFCNSISNLEEHHCFGGANRSKSEKYGLVVNLCVLHHRGDESVHMHKNIDLMVKVYAQGEFERVYGHDKWMAEFYKNYL